MPVVHQDVTETVSQAVQIQLVQLPVPQPVVMAVQITAEAQGVQDSAILPALQVVTRTVKVALQ